MKNYSFLYTLFCLMCFSLGSAHAIIEMDSSENSEVEIDISDAVGNGRLQGIQVFVSREAFEGCLEFEVSTKVKGRESKDDSAITLGEFCPYQVEYEKDGQPLSMSKTLKNSSNLRYLRTLTIRHQSGKPIDILELRAQTKQFKENYIDTKETDISLPIKIPVSEIKNIISRKVVAGIRFKRTAYNTFYVTSVVDGKRTIKGEHLSKTYPQAYDYRRFSVSDQNESQVSLNFDSQILDGQNREFTALDPKHIARYEIIENIYYLKTVSLHK